MHTRLSADTDLVRAYGSASAGHAAALREAAARLHTVGADTSSFGPVGAAFLAALGRAVGSQAQTLGGLSDALSAARWAAHRSANAYEAADEWSGTRIAGTR